MVIIYGRLTFTNELLGTASGDPEVHKAYIASKAPDAPSLEEEVASIGVEGVIADKKTVFSRDPKTKAVHIWDYQLKGQFKSAIGALRTIEKPSKSSKAKATAAAADDGAEEKKKKNPAYACGRITNYLKKVDTLVHVYPRRIKLHLPEGAEIGECERPLRAKTAQGDRVALANSETVPEGTYCDIQIVLFDDTHEEAVRECLDFGAFHGLGQWRNSGKGRFMWQEMDEDGNLIETKNRFMPKILLE